MKDKAAVEAMIDVMEGQSRVTRAPDFFHGVIDALKWVLADNEDDVPTTMLAWQLVTGDVPKEKETP